MDKDKENNTIQYSFVKQAAILAAAGIIARIIGFLYRIPMTNTIGDEGNSIYGASYTLYNIFLVLSSAGLPAAISKMVSERITMHRHDEAHRIFRIALTWAFVVGLAGSLALIFGANFFADILNNTKSYYALLTLSPTICIVGVMAVFRGYFQGMGSTIPTAISQLVEQVFNAVFSIVLMCAFMTIVLPPDNPIFGDKSALGAAGGTAGTGVGAIAGLIFIIGFYFLMRPVILRDIHKCSKTKYSSPSNGALAFELLRISVPIIAGTAIFSFSNAIDAAMVARRIESAGFTNDEALSFYGIYSGKFITMTTLPVSISAALATAAIPSIAASASLKDKKAIKNKINTALRVVMLISVPATVGLGVLADPIFHMLFSNSPKGAELLSFGAISIIFLALSQIATGMLQGIGRINIPVIAAVCGVAVKIPLNYILCAIPEINIYGAIISTIACYAITSTINMVFLSLETQTKPDFISILLKPLIASAGMGISCFVIYYVCYFIVPINSLALCIAILFGITIYFVFMTLIRGLNAQDLRLIPFCGKLADYMEQKKLI